MKLISLYPYDDVYQVVSEDESSVHFQGSKSDCKKFIEKIKLNEKLRAKAQSKLYHQTILQRNI